MAARNERAGYREKRLRHTIVTSSAGSDEGTAARRSARVFCVSQRDPESLAPLISLIEDDLLLRSLLVEWLTADGYRVDFANDARVDGPDAGAATPATAGQAKTQLLIVDVFMPRGQGIECLRLARRAHPGVPVIAISGQFNPGVDATGGAAAALNVDRVIAKPFEREAMLDAVRSLVARPD